MSECEIGQIVRSKAGRDKDRWMLIVGIDGDYVFLADGDLRKISRPKRKKIKHITKTQSVITSIQKDLLSNKKIQNAEIRKLLEPWQNKTRRD